MHFFWRAWKVWGRYTFLCYEPILEINASKWNINIKDKNGLKTIKGNPKDIIRKILKEYKTPKIDDMPTFTGGLAGYFSYDYIRYNEKKLDFEEYDNKFYDLNLSLFNDVIIFDNFKQKIILISGIEISKLDSQYDKALEKLDSIEKLLKTESKKYKNSIGKWRSKSKRYKNAFSKKYCFSIPYRRRIKRSRS